jgi:diguanylate cyclase (GGDEF)-like protein/PAS domain S-box-containing protein
MSGWLEGHYSEDMVDRNELKSHNTSGGSRPVGLSAPVVPVILLLVALFLVEGALMVILSTLSVSTAVEGFLDALGLTVIMGPIVYILVFRPLLRALRVAQRADDEKAVSADQYRRLIEFSPNGTLVLDHDQVEFANNAAMALIGADTVDEIVGRSILEVFTPECRETLKKYLVASMRGYTITPGMNLDVLGRDGSESHVETTIIPMVTAEGTKLLMLLADVTERRASELALLSTRESFESIILQSVIGYLIVDLGGVITFANDEAATMLGTSREALLGSPFKFPIKAGEDQELGIMTRGGEKGLAEMHFSNTRWENEPATLVMLRNITESAELREELRALSVMDELTQIYNRRGFLELALHQLKMAKRSGTSIGVLFIDLDRMKWINDTLGHQVGDQALREIAGILKDTFRESDIIGRMGGDEFAVMVIGASVQSEGGLVASVRKSVEIVNTHKNRKYKLECSIGYVRYNPEQHRSVNELIAAADDLMYQEKHSKGATRDALMGE